MMGLALMKGVTKRRAKKERNGCRDEAIVKKICRRSEREGDGVDGQTESEQTVDLCTSAVRW
jgi:hypothetical protein